MIFIIPIIIGAIGVAVGAVGGALAAHAAGEKDRQAAKHHRGVENELQNKYIALRKRHDEIVNTTKAQISDLERKLAISEVEIDALRLAIELKGAVIHLMDSIARNPSHEALNQLNLALNVTNQVLSQLNISLLEVSQDYFTHNLSRIGEQEAINTISPSKVAKGKKILTYGAQISIQACNGRYVMSDLNKGGKLSATAEHTKEWELFEIVDASNQHSNNQNRPVRFGDKVALRAVNNSNFVAINFQDQLISRQTCLQKTWETFTLIHPVSRRRGRIWYGSSIVLRAYNGKQVKCNLHEEAALQANAPHIKEWEIFTLKAPQ
jgi:gas vesicle protein